MSLLEHLLQVEESAKAAESAAMLLKTKSQAAQSEDEAHLKKIQRLQEEKERLISENAQLIEQLSSAEAEDSKANDRIEKRFKDCDRERLSLLSENQELRGERDEVCPQCLIHSVLSVLK